MSSLKSPTLVPDQNGIEVDMRQLLRGRKEGVSNEGEERNVAISQSELASQVSQISLQSVQEIELLIAGLQGIRQKLEDDGSRIQRQIGNYTSFSQSVVDLTKLVTEATTAIKTTAPEVIEFHTASQRN